MSYLNIPEEVRQFNHWLVWKGEKKENGKITKIPLQVANGYNADVTNPAHWSSFEQALYVVQNNPDKVDGIGFALNCVDPYTILDLDDPEGNVQHFENQKKIFDTFDSYSELSPSGKGLHIVVKGKIPKGMRRDHVEVYSQDRFMCFTGEVYKDAPIAHRQELLDILWADMGVPEHHYNIQDKPQIKSDEEILDITFKAINGVKALDLYNGNWQSYYQSQSEADFALIDILVFYTKNVEQVKRLFWQSALGQRDKAKRNDYLMRMIKRAFDRQLPDLDLEVLRINAQKIQEGLAANQETTSPSGYLPASEAQTEIAREEVEARPNSSIAEANLIAAKASVKIADMSKVTVDYPLPRVLPPGLLKELTEYILQQAPYPCYEIALVGAIGLLSGICGRAYNISGAGLNFYICVLAETGVGKEQIRSGYDNIFSQLLPMFPQADFFDGPSDFRSGQSFNSYFQESPCFVSIIGEFGKYYAELNNNRANPNSQSITRELLNLYTKSGFNRKLGKSVYADKNKNTKRVPSPALTIVGESTPSSFWEAVTEDDISSGFLNRFAVIEYKGLRPHKNKYPDNKVPVSLLNKLRDLMAHCFSYMDTTPPTDVKLMPEAQLILDEVEHKATDLINNKDLTVRKDLWSRANLKVQKLAGILAISQNPWNPVIDKDIMRWAYDFISHEIEAVFKQFDKGEYGVESRITYASDSNQIKEVIRVIGRYVKREEKATSDRFSNEMIRDGVYPFSVIQQKTSNVMCFKKDKLGASAAFKRAMQTLIDAGDIQEVNMNQAETVYQKRAKMFVVKNYSLFV